MGRINIEWGPLGNKLFLFDLTLFLFLFFDWLICYFRDSFSSKIKPRDCLLLRGVFEVGKQTGLSVGGVKKGRVCLNVFGHTQFEV